MHTLTRLRASQGYFPVVTFAVIESLLCARNCVKCLQTSLFTSQISVQRKYYYSWDIEQEQRLREVVVPSRTAVELYFAESILIEIHVCLALKLPVFFLGCPTCSILDLHSRFQPFNSNKPSPCKQILITLSFVLTYQSVCQALIEYLLCAKCCEQNW